MQLLEIFPKIALGNNQVMYSTHSHYMINPEWLDQAFIVSNSAVDYEDFAAKPAGPRRTSTDISVERYRNFVGRNPDKSTYFQPVLDKLDVTPSRLDLLRRSVLVEGKGDYLILEYGRKVIIESEFDFAVVPTRGAEGMNELIGLFLGWGVDFGVCLDDDKPGKASRERYTKEWVLPPGRLMTLASASADLVGKSIEGLLDQADIELIRDHFSLKSKPTKSQVQLFFSEALASRKPLPMSAFYRSQISKIDEAFAALFTW
mgnify:CR=1 FL=1